MLLFHTFARDSLTPSLIHNLNTLDSFKYQQINSQLAPLLMSRTKAWKLGEGLFKKTRERKNCLFLPLDESHLLVAKIKVVGESSPFYKVHAFLNAKTVSVKCFFVEGEVLLSLTAFLDNDTLRRAGPLLKSGGILWIYWGRLKRT